MTPRPDEFDFQLRCGGMDFSIAVVVVPFGAFIALISYAYIDELLGEFSFEKAGQYVGLLIFCLFLAGTILHAVTIPARQRFTEDGISTPTWRGRRFFRWNDVTDAVVVQGKGGTNMAMVTRNGRCTIYLDSYRKQATLFHALAQRIPVPIRIADSVLHSMRDSP